MWLLDLLEPMEPIVGRVFSMEACSDDGQWISDGREVWMNERLCFFSNCSLAQGHQVEDFGKAMVLKPSDFYGNYFDVLTICAPKPSSKNGK
jgi:hypothetical protein